MAAATPLPANGMAALQAGNKIEAIKRLREATGLGLTQAKEAIDHGEIGIASQPFAASSAGPLPLPLPVARALQRGNTREAIKLLRESTGLGLQEAKDLLAGSAPGPLSKASLRAPGEVSRSGTLAWRLAAAALLAVAAYHLLRG